MRREYIAWFDMPNNGKLHGQSVMPQQELIRCKDCKFYKEPTMYEVTECWYMEAGGYPNPTDYCRWAERKEE